MWLPDYNDRPAFEEYRYDALGRRVLVRTRSEYECDWNCRNAITRVVWNGDQILYEISSPGATSATTAQLEQDTAQAVRQDSVDYTPWGRLVYTHGVALDAPLELWRMNFSNVFPQPTQVLPVTNWKGQYDLGIIAGYQNPSPSGANYCQRYPTPQDTFYCFKFDWLAPYMWKTLYSRSRGVQGPNSWMGSLVESGRDNSGQMYSRNRYYDPATGRFTQEDPIGLAGGLNLYGFARGDPVNFADPFGLALCLRKTENMSTLQVAKLMVAVAEVSHSDIVWENNCVKSWKARPGKGWEEIQSRFGFMVHSGDTARVEWGSASQAVRSSLIATIQETNLGQYVVDSPFDILTGTCGSNVRADFTVASTVAHEVIGHLYNYMAKAQVPDQDEAIRIANEYLAASHWARRCIWYK